MDAPSTHDVVHAAYDVGINLFDTADVYANGRAEEALGQALQGHGFPCAGGPRNQAVTIGVTGVKEYLADVGSAD